MRNASLLLACKSRVGFGCDAKAYGRQDSRMDRETVPAIDIGDSTAALARMLDSSALPRVCES